MSGALPFTPGATMMPAGTDRPRIVARLMASRSMASDIASRTRLSLNGFLPVTLLPLSCSLPWSMPMKIVRVSLPSATFNFGSAFSRPTSCVGMSDSRSTSPDSSAATRVGSDLIGV